jgi:hypothetical protein
MATKAGYVIKDAFMKELNDFDIVALGDQDCGSPCCKLGIYFQTYVFVYDDFFTKTNPNFNKAVPVTYKRNNLYNMGKFAGVADRAGIEQGYVTGEFMLRSVIKIEQLTEDMMYLRSDMLEDIKNGRITERVQRKAANNIIAEARKKNLIA